MTDPAPPKGSPSETSPETGVDARAGTDPGGVSRRSFIQTLGLSAAAGALAPAGSAAADRAHSKDTAAGDAVVRGPGPIPLELRVNGQAMSARVEPAATLLDVLRIDLGLTGSKEICDRGACGGCSVLVDGRLVASCMMLAVDAEGAEVTTIEGLGAAGTLDPLQVAFIRHDALQCGFCTPGLIMASKALLQETPRPSLDEIKRGLSGNLCRCGAYTNVFNAVLEASGQEPLRDVGSAGGKERTGDGIGAAGAGGR